MSADNEQIKESVCIELTKDKMMGVISFIPPQNGGAKITLEEVKTAIKDKGIIQGVKDDDVIELCGEHKYNHKYIIAQGKPPVEGKDGSIEFAFDVKALKEFKPKENDDGTVDLKDLSVVKNVRKGEILARKIPAVQGQSGYNVLGQELKPRKVKEARIPKGRNTAILPDNITLVADIDGKLEYDDHNIYVNSVYTVMGDVDGSIGNIDFVGSVVVHGSVHSGFTIKAGGSVEVKGPVEDAIIIAGEDIFLAYGIQGTEKSKLVAKGNIITKFIQNANVEADGNIITEAILHSTVTAGDSIRAEIGKGTIVGGSVAATNLILARSIGSIMGTSTVVQIGVPPNLFSEYKQLLVEVKEKREEIAKIDKSITFLIAKSQNGQLNPQKRAMLQQLNNTRMPVVEEYGTLKARCDKLGEILNEAKEGIIQAQRVYPGVKVVFGNLVKYVDDTRTNVTIKKQDGEIYIGM